MLLPKLNYFQGVLGKQNRVFPTSLAFQHTMQIKLFHIRLTKEHLIEDQNNINAFLDTVIVKKTSVSLINGTTNFWSIVVFYEEGVVKEPIETITNATVLPEENLTEQERHIYLALKEWRTEKAAEANLPAFMICHNSELVALATAKPKTLEEISKIKGFGPNKITKFGEEIITFFHSI